MWDTARQGADDAYSRCNQLAVVCQVSNRSPTIRKCFLLNRINYEFNESFELMDVQPTQFGIFKRTGSKTRKLIHAHTQPGSETTELNSGNCVRV